MASNKHVARLKIGVEAWIQWRRENSDFRPDLHNADLSNADLSGEYIMERT
jgi:hypothetical protein